MLKEIISTATADLIELMEGFHPIPIELFRKLVKEGADVMEKVSFYRGEGLETIPIVTRCILTEPVDIAIACLETPNKLEFIIKGAQGEVMRSSPLLAIAIRNSGSDEDNCVIARALVARVKEHPEDIIEWEKTYRNTEEWSSTEPPVDILSVAAERQMLSVLWPIFSGVSYFQKRRGNIPLRGRLWEVDWDLLGQGQEKFIKDMSPTLYITADAATARLWKLSQQTRVWPPVLNSVEECVKNNANISYEVPATTLVLEPTIFANFIRLGQMDYVSACLKTKNPINYTIVDKRGRSALHAIVELIESALGEEFPKEVMKVVASRLRDPERNLSDLVDWYQKDIYGSHFFSLAADNQYLSVVCPEIQDLPEFQDSSKPITLTGNLWKFDFDKLKEKCPNVFERFKVPDVYLRSGEKEPDRRLWKAIFQIPGPDTKVIRKCVEARADINAEVLRFEMDGSWQYVSLLGYTLFTGDIELVKALLASPERIDFSKKYNCGFTALHFIVFNSKRAPHTVEKLLLLVLNRLDAHHDDKINWEEKDKNELDIVSCAGKNGHLSPFVEVVYHTHPVPYFTRNNVPIDIAVVKTDWEKISEKDQKRFKVTGWITR